MGDNSAIVLKTLKQFGQEAIVPLNQKVDMLEEDLRARLSRTQRDLEMLQIEVDGIPKVIFSATEPATVAANTIVYVYEG